MDPSTTLSLTVTFAVIAAAVTHAVWNAIAHGRGFLQPPAPNYLVSRSSLLAAEVGLVFATLYTAPARAGRAMRTRFVSEYVDEQLEMVAQIMKSERTALDFPEDVTDKFLECLRSLKMMLGPGYQLH